MQVGAGALLVLEVPLNPSACMCQSMRSAADSITFPPLIPVTASCSADDNSNCGGFSCDATVQPVGTYNSRVAIDPCTEVVTVNVVDSSSGESVFQHDFSQSQSLPLDISSFIRTTLYVLIDHYMYSVRVMVSRTTHSQEGGCNCWSSQCLAT